jgi:anti-sigma-K factor RskA
MVYRMWLVSHEHGTRALCSFTAAGRCPSGALGTVGRAGLMGGVLQVTLEPLGLSLATPTGKVVFYGRALTR